MIANKNTESTWKDLSTHTGCLFYYINKYKIFYKNLLIFCYIVL